MVLVHLDIYVTPYYVIGYVKNPKTSPNEPVIGMVMKQN